MEFLLYWLHVWVGSLTSRYVVDQVVDQNFAWKMASSNSVVREHCWMVIRITEWLIDNISYRPSSPIIPAQEKCQKGQNPQTSNSQGHSKDLFRATLSVWIFFAWISDLSPGGKKSCYGCYGPFAWVGHSGTKTAMLDGKVRTGTSKTKKAWLVEMFCSVI